MKALSKIIINNPSLIDLDRIHIQWYLLESIAHFENAQSDFPVEITDVLEIISPTETRVLYDDYCEITIKMEDNETIVTIKDIRKK